MAFAQNLLRKMLSDSVTDKHYDIFFVITSSTPTLTRLGAHKVVLSAISPCFEAATQTSDEGVEEIHISECTPSAVREALEIMYGGDLKESRKSIVLALEVWHFGVIFKVEHLVHLARGSCMNNLSTENCLKILDFAVCVGDMQIVDKLQNYAADNANFSHVISSPDFERLDFTVISSLVRPGKGECAWPEILTFEKVWFDALMKWLDRRLANGGDVEMIEEVLNLIDLSRMKTHELREASKNNVALSSARFSIELVGVLLTRSEQLEGNILERNIDLDVIGQKYQQALCEQDEAERKMRAAVEKMDELQSSKNSLERRYEEMRRRRGSSNSVSGRRKVSGSSTII